jgi:hypothetical protein
VRATIVIASSNEETGDSYIGYWADSSGTGKWIGWKKLNTEEYSTNEVKVGTWIDGKPIYRKVFTGRITANANTEVQTVLQTNVDNVIDMGGWYMDGNLDTKKVLGQCKFTISGTTVTMTNNSRVDVYNSNLLLFTWSAAGRSDSYEYNYYMVWAEYTKTTN